MFYFMNVVFLCFYFRMFNKKNSIDLFDRFFNQNFIKAVKT